MIAGPVQEYKGEVGGSLKMYMKINRKLGMPTSQASHTHKLICSAMRLMGTGKHMPRAGILDLCSPTKLGRVQNCLWIITDSCTAWQSVSGETTQSLAPHSLGSITCLTQIKYLLITSSSCTSTNCTTVLTKNI